MADKQVTVSDYVFDENLATAATPPSHWYTDPSILEQEKTKIFARIRVAIFLSNQNFLTRCVYLSPRLSGAGLEADQSVNDRRHRGKT